MNKLTARQIEYFDTLSRDVEAHKRTLQVAINYHANVNIEIQKKMDELWDELANIYDLDLVTKDYRIESVDGNVCIVEKDMEG